jgi:hypothetical protein
MDRSLVLDEWDMRSTLFIFIFLLLVAPATAAADEGITLPALVATTPSLGSVGIASSGIVYASTGGQVLVFGPAGQTIATWPARGTMAVAPGGELYTLDRQVTRWSWDGRVLARWGGFRLGEGLAVAPDGTVLVGGGRYTPVGERLGALPGPGLPAGAGGERTWMAQETAVVGYDRSGHAFATLGNICPIGGDGPVCSWHFSYPRSAATPDGGVLVADAGDSRLEGYDRDGSLRFTCTRAIGLDRLTSIAVLGDDVILGAGSGVYRAKLTTDAQPACRSPRLVGKVRVARRGTALRVSFTLSRRASVPIRAHGRTTTRRLLRGRHTVVLRNVRGRGYVTVGDAPRVSYSPPR